MKTAIKSMPWVLTFFALLACSRSPETPGPIVKGQLSRAVVAKDYDQLRQILAAGGDINENMGSSDDSVTPVLIASALGDVEMVSFLLNHGASLSATYKGFNAKDFTFLKFGDESEIYKRLQTSKEGN